MSKKYLFMKIYGYVSVVVTALLSLISFVLMFITNDMNFLASFSICGIIAMYLYFRVKSYEA